MVYLKTNLIIMLVSIAKGQSNEYGDFFSSDTSKFETRTAAPQANDLTDDFEDIFSKDPTKFSTVKESNEESINLLDIFKSDPSLFDVRVNSPDIAACTCLHRDDCDMPTDGFGTLQIR